MVFFISCLALLSFLNLQIYVFHWVWHDFGYYFLNCYFVSQSLFFSPCWITMTCMYFFKLFQGFWGSVGFYFLSLPQLDDFFCLLSKWQILSTINSILLFVHSVSFSFQMFYFSVLSFPFVSFLVMFLHQEDFHSLWVYFPLLCEVLLYTSCLRSLSIGFDTCVIFLLCICSLFNWLVSWLFVYHLFLCISWIFWTLCIDPGPAKIF